MRIQTLVDASLLTALTAWLCSDDFWKWASLICEVAATLPRGAYALLMVPH